MSRIAEARSELERLLAPTSIIPCTRVQWAAWLGDHVAELRKRMRRSEAVQRRRELNIRIDKRSDLPSGTRIQPQADEHRATTWWGKLLELRSGWYGSQADSGRRMFYVMHLSRKTYVINLEPYRQIGGQCPYHIKDFMLTDSMMTLVAFEQMLQHERIHSVYDLHVEADQSPATCGIPPATRGIRLKPVLCTLLTTPAKSTKKTPSTGVALARDEGRTPK